MADNQTGAVGTAAAEQAAVDRATAFLGGMTDTSTPVPAPAPTPVVKAEEPKPDPAKQSLAEVIRSEREARKQREEASLKAKDLEFKFTEAQAEIDKLRRANDFENDPIAYAKARGWDKEKQALMGQMLLYDLVPDKAPADLRQKLFESKHEREKREEAEKRTQEEQTRTQQAAQQQYQQFVAVVDQAAAAFEEGSFPESQAWFINPASGEMDHDTYVRSLVATATNMANAAAREGRVADLSPASIAKTLEAEVARRMTARDAKVQKRTKPVEPASQQQVAPVAPGGMQPTESTKGTYGAGAPRPAATSDAERIARAMAVLNRPRS
jgi:hypothetical protein